MYTLNRRQFIGTSGAAIGAAVASAATPASAANPTIRPNILVLFPDQHRFDWTGLNKSLPVRTPHIDRLAATGMRFTKAVVASPLCAPSRACLAAGKEYDRCRVRGNDVDYPLDQPTFYTMLRESGYHVAGCGKIDLHKATRDWGPDGKRLLPEWGFSDGIDNAGKGDAIHSGGDVPKDPYMAYLHKRNLAAAHVADLDRRFANGYKDTVPTPLDDEAYCDNWITRNGLGLMKQFPKGKPWYMVVNFVCPHPPEDITARMEKTVRGRNFPQPNRSKQWDAVTHEAVRQNYTAMVENVDRLVGEFIDEVNRRGELDNTIIVYSSDHGEMLGDHDRWGKVVPYHASSSVPLIISGPGIAKGVTSSALVSHMDLAATCLDYAGVNRPADMDSRSVKPLLEGKTRTHREFVLSGLATWRMAWDGQFKVITGFDEDKSQRGASAKPPRPADIPPLLFDLDADPLENVNLAAKDPDRVRKMLTMLPRNRPGAPA